MKLDKDDYSQWLVKHMQLVQRDLSATKGITKRVLVNNKVPYSLYGFMFLNRKKTGKKEHQNKKTNNDDLASYHTGQNILGTKDYWGNKNLTNSIFLL